MDADTWTLDFMEKNPQLFPWGSFASVLPRFCAEMQRALPDGAARELLIAADTAGDGLIPFRRFHVRQQLAFSGQFGQSQLWQEVPRSPCTLTHCACTMK